MLTKIRSSKEIIFEMLLISENRTTDILEIITNEKIYPVVLNQQEATDIFNEKIKDEARKGKHVILRETSLYTRDTHRVVSVNSGFICKEYVPPELYLGIIGKEKGIGEIMAGMNINSSRRILQKGWRSEDSLVDICDKGFSNNFGTVETLIPFKKYELMFAGYAQPGIYLIEYYNPYVLN
ncbi:hypothetical protein [Bacillus sp. REN10]|uniref:hypothetical protein n=1 Tax=Bacillus sp. REN10 TaxID=2782541 RepID=UPI00193B5E15|nr:hypothetical protein [Bacillus sp. REN10]